jgi:hypothetical protein
MPNSSEPQSAGATVQERGSDTEDASFLEWRDRLPFFDVDGQRFYLPTGDIPMDHAEIEDLWQFIQSGHSEHDDTKSSGQGSYVY